MTYLRSNWRLERKHLPSSQADVDILGSLLVSDVLGTLLMKDIMGSLLLQIQQTAQLDSVSANLATFSMAGYGKPAWVVIQLASYHPTLFQFRTSINGSIINLSLIAQSSVCLVSLAATVSYPFLVTGLIASR